MYEVTVEGRFSAAHRHPGEQPEEAVHGHDFVVLVRLAGERLEDDVLVDFHDVELALKAELKELSYSDLDTHPHFAKRRATPAALARWLYQRLETRLEAPAGIGLSSIEVRDTENTGARYWSDERSKAAASTVLGAESNTE